MTKRFEVFLLDIAEQDTEHTDKVSFVELIDVLAAKHFGGSRNIVSPAYAGMQAGIKL